MAIKADRVNDPFASDAPEASRPWLGRVARWLRRMTLDPAQRYNQLMRLGLVGGAFQPDNATWEDRYPRVFDFVASRIGDGAGMRLLSFGCSTGEEAFTLRRRYPGASVRGLDINPANIRRCLQQQRARADAAVSFAQAGSTRDEAAERFDVIFCMAVLHDGRLSKIPREDCRPYLSFDDFTRVIGDFHRCLKPGGLLALRHANFRVRDTRWADRLEPVFTLPPGMGGRLPIYGPDNRLMRGVDNPEAVLRKVQPIA